ncbi:hypothetical protein [Sphingomonas sp. 22R3R2A-7]|uniref:hypothetical protein n=1 Tax=Sphingomonas sp. 22R3R2A-7 TaxID=3050230 RepID=UPI002FDFD7D1
MQPFAIAVALGFVWTLNHFWLLPRVKADWVARDLRGKMSRAGVLTVLEKVGELAGIGALALLGLLLLIAAASLLADADAAWPRAFVNALGLLHTLTKTIATGYGTAIGWIGFLGAAGALWISARRARRRVVDVWMAKASEEQAAILDDPSRLDEARADPELEPLVEQIDLTIQELHATETQEHDAGSRQRLQGVLNELLSALSVERSRKNMDFAETIDAASADDDPAPNGWRRIVNIVSSKKFAEDIGLARKPLNRLVTALLFVSLIGWSAAPLANSLRPTVNNLRIQLAADEAQERLNEVMSRPAPPAQPDEDDDDEEKDSNDANVPAGSVRAASRLVARAFAQEMARAPILDDAAGLPRRSTPDNEIVRGLLAEHSLAPADSLDDAASNLRREVALSASQPGVETGGAAVRHVEEQIAPIVERLQTEQPQRFRELLMRIEARYQDRIPTADARSKLTERMLDEVFTRIEVKSADQLGTQAQKLTKDFGKKALQTWADATVRSMMAHFVSGSAQPFVHRALALEASAGTRDLVASLQSRAGQNWMPAPNVADEGRMASKVAEAVVRLNPNLADFERSQMRMQLAGYDAIFPAASDPIVPPNLDSPAPDSFGGVDGVGSSERADASRRAMRGGATGSRYASFQIASRSFRARGVVIGRELAGSLDVTDMRWKIVPPPRRGAATRVAIDLKLLDARTGKATWHPAGSFDAGTLNQAIRYAADGRVIATTIMAGDGKQIGRLTSLHPTLSDTPLGCRIIESDRWVDTFSMSPAGGALRNDREQTALWLRRVKLAEIAAGDARACTSPELQRIVANRSFATPSFSPTYGRALNGFLGLRLRQPAGSAQFLRAASECAGASRSAALGCMCGGLRAQGLPERYWFPEDHTSQVRERPARLTADMRWLRPSPDRLGNVDFWIHTTFSLRSQGEGDENNTVAFDFPPPSIAALRTLVRAKLPAHLARNGGSTSYEDFMRPLEEFVLAQRLVRAALDNKLGRNFASARFLQLAKETRRFVPRQPTLRWEAAGDPRTLLNLLNKTDTGAARHYSEYLLDTTRRSLGRRPMCDNASL